MTMYVNDLMTTRLVTVGFDETLATVREIFLHAHIHHVLVANAIALFMANPISCIPVVDGAFSPIGVVSWRDVLRREPRAGKRDAGGLDQARTGR